MNREQAKEMWPIVKAYAEGKIIEHINEGNQIWISYNEYKFNDMPQRYRIKPEPVYKAFKNDKECLEEMHKHQPFGWILDKAGNPYNTLGMDSYRICTLDFNFKNDIYNYDAAFKCFKFLDGSPFGKLIKE